MFSVLGSINWLGFAISLVASWVIAGVYFPVVIAKPYVRALGREGQPAPRATPVRNFGPLVCVLITTLSTAILVAALDISEISDAVVFGLIVGIGYLSAMVVQIAINPSFPRPLFYASLNAPYFIITSVLSSVVLTAMS